VLFSPLFPRMIDRFRFLLNPRVFFPAESLSEPPSRFCQDHPPPYMVARFSPFFMQTAMLPHCGIVVFSFLDFGSRWREDRSFHPQETNRNCAEPARFKAFFLYFSMRETCRVLVFHLFFIGVGGVVLRRPIGFFTIDGHRARSRMVFFFLSSIWMILPSFARHHFSHK